jgi:hypothetical protein
MMIALTLIKDIERAIVLIVRVGLEHSARWMGWRFIVDVVN